MVGRLFGVRPVPLVQTRMGLVAEHQHVSHEKAAIGFYAQGGQNMADLVRLARYQTVHVVMYK